MNISDKDAQELLTVVEDVTSRTRKALDSSYTSPLLILWGLIWFAAFLGTHFFVVWAWHIWTVLDTVGLVGTFLIIRRQLRAAVPIRSSISKKIGWRIFWFWTLIFIYTSIFMSMLAPYNGLQMNAFICTMIAFAFIMLGFWFESSFMIWLGLVVTAITLVGFYLIPHSYYCLWMAFMAGGALFGTGLYVRLKWK